MKNKHYFKIIYNVAIATLLTYIFVHFCFSENGLMHLSKNLKSFNKAWLIMAMIVQLLSVAADILLVYYFASHSAPGYSLKNAIKTAMVGLFFNSITPCSSGGQPMQIYLMSKQGVEGGSATSALIQKFLVWQNVLVCYSIFALIYRFNYFNSLDKNIWSWALIGFIIQMSVIVVLFLFSFNQKVTMKLIRSVFNLLGKMHLVKNPISKVDNLKEQMTAFHQGNSALYKNKRLVLITYSLSFVQMSATFIVPYCIYRSFNLAGKPAINMICAQAFIVMVTHFFPVPGAAGAAEGANAIFLGDFFSETTIKPAVIIIRLINYYFMVLLSFPFSRLVKKQRSEVLDE